jgi:HEAT repeat protein
MKRHLTISLVVLAALSLGLMGRWWIAKSPAYRGKTLEAWSMQSYYSPDPKLRAEATAVVQDLGPQAVPGLIRLLRTQDATLNRKAWAVVPALPLWARRLVHGSIRPPEAATVRAAAAHSLGLIGPEARTAATFLGLCLRDLQGTVRWDAATALSRMGPEGVPPLAEALSDPNAEVRQAAASGLSQVVTGADPALPGLITCLGDENARVRERAASAVLAIGKPALPALIEAVEQGQGPRRQAAAAVLMRIYPLPRVAEAPMLKMVVDESPAARQQAIESLASMHDWRPAALAAYTNALLDPVPEVRLAATRGLGQVGPKGEAAVPSLTALFGDESPLVRQAAAQTLGQFGAASQPALPGLKRLAEDHVPEVRTAAVDAQHRIEAGLATAGAGRPP